MSASTDDTLLSLRGVHKRYPGVHALKGVNFDVRRGEIHAVVGENGAGKTTLMQILAGVHQPDDGEMTFDGVRRTGFETERAAQAAGVAIEQETPIEVESPSALAEEQAALRRVATLVASGAEPAA